VEVLDVDLPVLARAVTSLMRGQASPQAFRLKDAGYVRILSRGLDVTICDADWAKILGLIRDGHFSTILVPVETGLRALASDVRLSASTTDDRDPLYARVLGVLALLFTRKVPT